MICTRSGKREHWPKVEMCVKCRKKEDFVRDFSHNRGWWRAWIQGGSFREQDIVCVYGGGHIRNILKWIIISLRLSRTFTVIFTLYSIPNDALLTTWWLAFGWDDGMYELLKELTPRQYFFFSIFFPFFSPCECGSHLCNTLKEIVISLRLWMTVTLIFTLATSRDNSSASRSEGHGTRTLTSIHQERQIKRQTTKSQLWWGMKTASSESMWRERSHHLAAHRSSICCSLNVFLLPKDEPKKGEGNVMAALVTLTGVIVTLCLSRMVTLTFT